MNSIEEILKTTLDEEGIQKLGDDFFSYVSTSSTQAEIPSDILMLYIWEILTITIRAIEKPAAVNDEILEWMKAILSMSIEDSANGDLKHE